MRQQENAICILIGRKPGVIERASMNDQIIPSTMNGNVSVRTLANRPDVKQAELSLQSAYALTDAAKAAFYPSFSISTLSVGFGAGGFSNFFKPANLAAEIIAGLTQPVLFERATERQSENHESPARRGFAHVFEYTIGSRTRSIRYFVQLQIVG